MIIGVKRPPVYDAEFHEHVKRFRLEEETSEDAAPGSPGTASIEEFIAAALRSSLDSGNRRCRTGCGIDDTPQEPAEKRPRYGLGHTSVDSTGADNADLGSTPSEAKIRSWAEAIVRALHGCPSVEEASKRCSRVLEEVEAEVRQATLNEVDRTPVGGSSGSSDCADDQSPTDGADGAGSPQELKSTNRILMRAVHHLAERCRRLEAGNEEVVALQKALEQSQAEQRRLQHSNEMLQGHLRIALAECDGRPLPWGNASL